MREKIEECFYRGDDHPKATNVGELIEQLKRLPPELKVDSNFSHGVQLVVLNVSSYRPFLELQEIDEEVEEDV